MLRALPLPAQPIARDIDQARPSGLVLDAVPEARVETRHLRAEAQGRSRMGADGRALLSVVVVPRANMHIYAADAQGYAPFTFTLEPLEGIRAGKVTFPPAETYVFPPTGETSRVYQQPFTVTQALAVAPPLREGVAKGETVNLVAAIRYQACDDTLCYRPTTARIAFTLTR